MSTGRSHEHRPESPTDLPGSAMQQSSGKTPQALARHAWRLHSVQTSQWNSDLRSWWGAHGGPHRGLQRAHSRSTQSTARVLAPGLRMSARTLQRRGATDQHRCFAVLAALKVKELVGIRSCCTLQVPTSSGQSCGTHIQQTAQSCVSSQVRKHFVSSGLHTVASVTVQRGGAHRLASIQARVPQCGSCKS